MRREFGPAVPQNSVEDASRGGVRVVAGVRLRVVVGAVERHVGMVRVPSSGHRDVEGLSGRSRFDQDVRSVGRDALCAVGGDRVTEFDMLGHIRRWKDDAAAEPAPMLAGLDGSVLLDCGSGPVVACDGDGPVVADGGDGPLAESDPIFGSSAGTDSGNNYPRPRTRGHGGTLSRS